MFAMNFNSIINVTHVEYCSTNILRESAVIARITSYQNINLNHTIRWHWK